MSSGIPLITQILREPERSLDLSLRQWDVLIRQARTALLLGKLSAQLHRIGVYEGVPEAPKQHLFAADTFYARQRIALRFETGRILDALRSEAVQPIFMKGAAYEIAGLPAAEGRLFNDLDILVPRAALDAVESALKRHGYSDVHHDAYDQRYYRKWMHEIPPLMHPQRGSVIDVHHNILPSTAVLKPDAALLLEAAQEVEGQPGVRVLQPVDLLLHSAVHLFFDGEFGHGLRDLTDMDALIRHYLRDATGWSRLLQRARELGLGRPLYYALRYAVRVLDTPVPEDVLGASEVFAPAGPARAFMDRVFLHGLAPAHPTCRRPLDSAARKLLYTRGHLLRMPLHLLIPHLARKALRGSAVDDTHQAKN